MLIASDISWHQISFTRAQADIADRGRKEACSPASPKDWGTPKMGPSAANGSQQAQEGYAAQRTCICRKVTAHGS